MRPRHFAAEIRDCGNASPARPLVVRRRTKLPTNDVGNGCPERADLNLRTRRRCLSRHWAVRIKVHVPRPLRSEMADVPCLAEVFLRRLEFDNQVHVVQRSEERVRWLADLKVIGSALDLQHNVRSCRVLFVPVFKQIKLPDRLVRPFRWMGKRTPNCNTIDGTQRISEEICTFELSDVVRIWPWLTFTISFDEKAAKRIRATVCGPRVLDQRSGVGPPFSHCCILRVRIR